jgi:hypothetical protein
MGRTPYCPGSQQKKVREVKERAYMFHVVLAQTGRLLTTFSHSVSRAPTYQPFFSRDKVMLEGVFRCDEEETYQRDSNVGSQGRNTSGHSNSMLG